MDTITIPRKLAAKDDLVVVPRQEYEKLFRFWASAERITAREKGGIERGLREIKQGKFFTPRELRHEVGL